MGHIWSSDTTKPVLPRSDQVHLRVRFDEVEFATGTGAKQEVGTGATKTGSRRCRVLGGQIQTIPTETQTPITPPPQEVTTNGVSTNNDTPADKSPSSTRRVIRRQRARISKYTESRSRWDHKEEKEKGWVLRGSHQPPQNPRHHES